MALWERFSATASITTVGNHSVTELIHNGQSTDDLFHEHPLVVVDGIVTIITDTDDLMGARLVVAHEIIVAGDLSDVVPDEHDAAIYYSWFCGRGPLVFRLQSKKTILPEHKLWLTLWKEQGDSAAANIHFGMRAYIQRKSN